MEAPSCVIDFANGVKERHPAWAMDTFVSFSPSAEEFGVVLCVHKWEEKGDWWESALMFALDFSPQQLEDARDDLLKWENEFIEKVGD